MHAQLSAVPERLAARVAHVVAFAGVRAAMASQRVRPREAAAAELAAVAERAAAADAVVAADATAAAAATGRRARRLPAGDGRDERIAETTTRRRRRRRRRRRPRRLQDAKFVFQFGHEVEKQQRTA